jgi:hypothetical protein
MRFDQWHDMTPPWEEWQSGYPYTQDVGRFKRWGQRKMQERALCLEHERREPVAEWRWTPGTGGNEGLVWAAARTVYGCLALYMHAPAAGVIKLMWHDGNKWVLADQHGSDIARQNRGG